MDSNTTTSLTKIKDCLEAYDSLEQVYLETLKKKKELEIELQMYKNQCQRYVSVLNDEY